VKYSRRSQEGGGTTLRDEVGERKAKGSQVSGWENMLELTGDHGEEVRYVPDMDSRRRWGLARYFTMIPKIRWKKSREGRGSYKAGRNVDRQKSRPLY